MLQSSSFVRKIHTNKTNILIEDVHFNNGDDNVAIKSCRDNDGWNHGRPSENIVIRNCYFKRLHVVVIGSEMSAACRMSLWKIVTMPGIANVGYM